MAGALEGLVRGVAELLAWAALVLAIGNAGLVAGAGMWYARLRKRRPEHTGCLPFVGAAVLLSILAGLYLVVLGVITARSRDGDAEATELGLYMGVPSLFAPGIIALGSAALGHLIVARRAKRSAGAQEAVDRGVRA